MLEGSLICGVVLQLVDHGYDRYRTAVEVTAGQSLFHYVVDTDETATTVLEILQCWKALSYAGSYCNLSIMGIVSLARGMFIGLERSLRHSTHEAMVSMLSLQRVIDQTSAVP
jgi:hypothetical protein